MTTNRTPEEMEAFLGLELKKLRLHRNITQQELAIQAGVSLGALKSLESGKGCTLKTLMNILKALGRESWIETVAPIPAINPLVMTLDAKPRQRAASRPGAMNVKPRQHQVDAIDATPVIKNTLITSLSGKQRAEMSLKELARYNATTPTTTSGKKK
ncbi:Helix-turn-helix [Methylobacillus rhizosphaerae]|uniref:Helix-turn-helix n=1 Tax=Methylobacillus rhizosphaerae TaxID=551994 RepID=A0A238YD44_9PROT|nr:helix-turn-helix transcriptional regulator [Methylobacillus rhizosphaerae]SNR68269.1 Helix-turn-helix [Methylobacillus rhizosphaerae]